MSTPTVTLRTGEVVPEAILKTTTIALSTLEWLDVYEAAALARNPAHQLWGPSSRALHSLGLLDQSGAMHDLTRKVILAATEGEDFGIHLVNPLPA